MKSSLGSRPGRAGPVQGRLQPRSRELPRPGDVPGQRARGRLCPDHRRRSFGVAYTDGNDGGAGKNARRKGKSTSDWVRKDRACNEGVETRLRQKRVLRSEFDAVSRFQERIRDPNGGPGPPARIRVNQYSDGRDAPLKNRARRCAPGSFRDRLLP